MRLTATALSMHEAFEDHFFYSEGFPLMHAQSVYDAEFIVYVMSEPRGWRACRRRLAKGIAVDKDRVKTHDWTAWEPACQEESHSGLQSLPDAKGTVTVADLAEDDDGNIFPEVLRGLVRNPPAPESMWTPSASELAIDFP